MWILLQQETVSGSGISWAIYKSAPRSRQITTPAPRQFLQAGCPSCRPTNSVKALKAKLLVTLLVTTVLQIYQGIFRWKKVGNRLRFDRFSATSLGASFLTHSAECRRLSGRGTVSDKSAPRNGPSVTDSCD